MLVLGIYIHPNIYLSIYLCIYLSIYLSIYLFIVVVLFILSYLILFHPILSKSFYIYLSAPSFHLELTREANSVFYNSTVRTYCFNSYHLLFGGFHPSPWENYMDKIGTTNLKNSETTWYFLYRKHHLELFVMLWSWFSWGYIGHKQKCEDRVKTYHSVINWIYNRLTAWAY